MGYGDGEWELPTSSKLMKIDHHLSSFFHARNSEGTGIWRMSWPQHSCFVSSLFFFFGLTFHLLVDTNQKSWWRNPWNEIMKTLIRTMVSVGVRCCCLEKLVSRMLMFMNLRSLRSHLFWCVPIFFGALFSFDSHGGHHRRCSRIEALLKRDPTHHQEAPESPETNFHPTSEVIATQKKIEMTEERGGSRDQRGFFIWLYKCNTFQQDISQLSSHMPYGGVSFQATAVATAVRAVTHEPLEDPRKKKVS